MGAAAEAETGDRDWRENEDSPKRLASSGMTADDQDY
jgi:hypothetical protein